MNAETMKKISDLLKTQDNRITADPIFIVQQKRRIYGLDSDYANEYEWVNADDQEVADEEEAKELDKKRDNREDTKPWRTCWYIDIWEFVTACFTEKGCENYIKINGHNLNEPRIYVESGWRNYEWQDVRGFLMGFDDND